LVSVIPDHWEEEGADVGAGTAPSAPTPTDPAGEVVLVEGVVAVRFLAIFFAGCSGDNLFFWCVDKLIAWIPLQAPNKELYLGGCIEEQCCAGLSRSPGDLAP
jgi:hypothetical protein